MSIPVPLPSPSNWPRVPAGRLFLRARREPSDYEEIVTAFRDGQVTRRSNRRTEGFTNAVHEIGYQGVRRGDLVIHSMDGFAGAIGVSDSDGKASPVVHAYVPANGVDARFFAYMLRTLARMGFVTSLARGIRERSTAFDSETFISLALAAPAPATQRATADYLDRETARIDALIAAKRRMVELLDERWKEFLDAVIWSDVTGTTRVMHIVDQRRPVMYGIVLPGPDVGGGGIAIVKGGDVAQRRLSWDALCKTTPEIEAPYARARLCGGDLMFAIRGGIGDVAIVPEGLAGANITQDVARVAPRPGICSQWLMYALESPTAQHDARMRVTGATITGLNIWELDRIVIPLASAERQARDLERLSREAQHIHAMRRALDCQLELLQERRQALITAAVTGQLNIPEAT